MQDLWQARYQILLIIYLKESIELNVNLDMMIKNMKHVELNEYCNCVLEYTNFKDDLIEYKCLNCNKSYQQRLDEKLK